MALYSQKLNVILLKRMTGRQLQNGMMFAQPKNLKAGHFSIKIGLNFYKDASDATVLKVDFNKFVKDVQKGINRNPKPL